MAVRKPLEKQKIESVDVGALIDKGAKVKEDQDSNIREWVHLNLRLTKDTLRDVDKLVYDRIGMTRTGWILEAIQEKIKKEKSNGN